MAPPAATAPLTSEDDGSLSATQDGAQDPPDTSHSSNGSPTPEPPSEYNDQGFPPLRPGPLETRYQEQGPSRQHQAPSHAPTGRANSSTRPRTPVSPWSGPPGAGAWTRTLLWRRKAKKEG